MPSSWQTLRATVPGPFLTALMLAGGFLAFVTWDQSHWWRAKEDYSFGWLAPAFAVFVVYDRWPKILAALAACSAPGSARARGWMGGLLRLVAGGGLVAGVALFLLGSFYRSGAGTSQLGTLAMTLGMVGILLSVLFMNAPDSPAPASAAPWADSRLRLTALFVFPVLIWLVSAPMVSAMESQVNLFLLRKIVVVVAFVFDLLGLPIEQHGNVLTLPTGNVGVEEACSGIRSLTGCLFAGSFLAAVFLDQGWKKITLVVAALALAVFTNLCRSLFLTSWAYRNGPASIEGTVHDTAGYAVLGLTVIGLLCLLPVLNMRIFAAEAPRSSSES